MQVERLWLTDFRNYRGGEFVPAPEGLTVVRGDNGEGKTNLLEAVGWLAMLRSFRDAPDEALVRTGCDQAVLRAEGSGPEGRRLLVEAELRRTGRDRVLVNRQPLRRTRDLLGVLKVSVFSPDDLALVKAGPAGRRQYLDDALVALRPRHHALVAEVDRVLRQRTALLKQAGGVSPARLAPDIAVTLDVWDAKLAAAGEALADARAALVVELGPEVAKAYGRLASARAGWSPAVDAAYLAPWRVEHGALAAALASARADDLRRGVTTLGPHRDDLVLSLDGLPARTHASQGEQRTLALALRLAVHTRLTESVGSPPILLLDDVFSELDPHRSSALLASLPIGQALLSTAGPLPEGVEPQAVTHVSDGQLSGGWSSTP